MHQAQMAAYLTIIYSANIGIEVEEGEIQRRVQQTPAAAAQAANDAEAAMAYCRDEILPELDLVDDAVIRPTLELTEIMKQIQKTMVKRNHKMIDYDRHRASLNKLKVKEERSFNEEKQIYKVEAQLETATQDYDYLNDMLKQQLPQFFHLKAQFIVPVFERFYFLQCRIYGMIYARCHELLHANEQHFVTYEMGIEQGFQWREQQYSARSDLENMDLLKSGGKAWLKVSGGSNNSKLSLKERAELREQEDKAMIGYNSPSMVAATSSSTNYNNNNNTTTSTTMISSPPAYGLASSQQSSSYQYQPSPQQQSRGVPPPPPSTSFGTINKKYVVALYDYDAQAEGDLSFRKDDKIELVERTADTNDWWTGRLHGITGIFPGNYVSEL
ncbi:uncharacterized protein BX664DRAFT_337447 [Halteromyces radiatus]|uniref:uncharacterized protein n=1 Tax=Halteromyces radiatus TaxID=101107 RepID=UPI00221F19E6|nr:uncharacterized protein BX664DRAFT_337447 [Halteromyces radiatus]KAI8084637.1 hypothetical protein BX664DRAFT_337447 [Halteromyces radiatus]